ncbi:unnamed protein product [Adineta ricciae]|uniref:G-protein coupled receptors family 1 profile domain-containing protein n=1 Tax=Adineta ricciae TaxID=249248 RepID=A0A814DAJ8_ADIRI|nr:unnamed protein product [Adineta ricciae]CAF1399149.1 unnamed protein product [Adineta ricciae]
MFNKDQSTSIDRTLITSSNVATRKRSTPRMIIITLIILLLFYAVVEIHGLLFMEILQHGPDYFVCFYQPGAYTTFMGYHALVVNGFIPPLLMVIFELWTVKNTRRRIPISHEMNRKHVDIGRPYHIQSKDKQFIRILLVDIIAFVIFKFPVTILVIYQQITQNSQISYFWHFIDSTIGFYTNVLVSKTFRTEFSFFVDHNVHWYCLKTTMVP